MTDYMSRYTTNRSITMYTMVEALAREHMREQIRAAQRAQLVRELAAAKRWRRVHSRARSASQRHAARAEQAYSAVAEANWA